MNEFNLYQTWAIQTLQPDSDTVYPAAKVGVEGSEYAQIVLKHVYHHKTLNKAALMDEAADVLWYLAVSLLQHDIDFSSVVDHSLEKIKKRHGSSYNQQYYACGKNRDELPKEPELVPNVGKVKEMKRHVVADGDLPEPEKIVLGYWNEPTWEKPARWAIARYFVDTDDEEESSGWETYNSHGFDMCVDPTFWFELPTVVGEGENN